MVVMIITVVRLSSPFPPVGVGLGHEDCKGDIGSYSIRTPQAISSIVAAAQAHSADLRLQIQAQTADATSDAGLSGWLAWVADRSQSASAVASEVQNPWPLAPWALPSSIKINGIFVQNVEAPALAILTPVLIRGLNE